MALRVLHVGKFYPPDQGGIEGFTQSLCRAQARRGHHVRALVHGSPGGEDLDQNVAVIRAPVRATVLFTPLSPAFRRLFVEQIVRETPDVLHAHLPNPSALWVLTVARSHRIPLVLHWHADIVASRIRTALRAAYALYRPLEWALLKRSDAVIATSPDYFEASAPLAPFARKVKVIPLGIDPTAYGNGTDPVPPWPKEASLRVLAVGRLTYYKGFLDLVHAVAALPNAALVIVGRGEEEPALRDAIATTGAGDRIQLVTDADDETRDRWLASSDIVCQPSVERTEAFGLVLLEAFAFEKPVVVADLEGSGAPWLVRETGAGVLFPPGDRRALTDSLASLGADPERRGVLGERGRRSLEARFTIDAVADEIDALYESLGAAERSGGSSA